MCYEIQGVNLNTDMLFIMHISILFSIGAHTEITIFPNPATDYIYINSDELIPGEPNNPLMIFNSLGQCLSNYIPSTIEGKQIRIDVSRLPTGIYFVR